MSTLANGFDDPFKPLGATVGILLVLAMLAVLAGAPWAVHQRIGPVVVQILGALVMGVIGLGLAYLSLTTEA